ncbi:MAG TPA: SIMPL domain-containing protein, partial [Devosia sp.]|nr:SIMPL domain-containing protein [Devosia sp.]
MRSLLALVPFALLTSLSLPALAGTILIEGHGEVTASPDTAYVTSGVTTQGTTARDALDLNTTAMAELMGALKGAGIESRDIQTSGFSVNPNYVYSEQRDANGYTLPPKINGYQVSNVVTVRVRALDTLGAILDKSVTVGANTINGISFAVADPAELLNEARKAAFADAKAKAELYATAAGSKLEDIVSINESQNFNQPPQPYMAKAMVQSASADVPVSAGELSFSINVSVQWDLEDAGK